MTRWRDAMLVRFWYGTLAQRLRSTRRYHAWGPRSRAQRNYRLRAERAIQAIHEAHNE